MLSCLCPWNIGESLLSYPREDKSINNTRHSSRESFPLTSVPHLVFFNESLQLLLNYGLLLVYKTKTKKSIVRGVTEEVIQGLHIGKILETLFLHLTGKVFIIYYNITSIFFYICDVRQNAVKY
jgi:hypothetical protein